MNGDALYALDIGMPIGIVNFLQAIDGKCALVIGMPIGIVDFLQAIDGKYALVIGMPIGIVDFLQATDGQNDSMHSHRIVIFFSALTLLCASPPRPFQVECSLA